MIECVHACDLKRSGCMQRAFVCVCTLVVADAFESAIRNCDTAFLSNCSRSRSGFLAMGSTGGAIRVKVFTPGTDEHDEA